MPDLHLVVMAGGSGTRFWPKSTRNRPKQLLSFGHGSKSLLSQTLSRFNSLVSAGNRIVVTTAHLRDAVAADAPGATVLAEPQGRNTAPCIYWAARVIAEKNPKAVMMVMPSDHYIANPEAFNETVRQACEWASRQDDLVTLGVKPSRPETGYGYLKVGGSRNSGGSALRVEAFVEKPDLKHAEEFLAAGNYLWNGGMFLWRAEVILRAFDQHMPEMKAAWEKHGGQVESAYPKMTATSIDFGVMEKASNVVTFPLDCGWDDLGSWTSLESLADVLQARHKSGVVSSGQVLAIDSERNIIDAEGKLVALLGVDDLIVVEHGKTLMVARKDRAQDIRLLVEEVKSQHPELA